MQKNGNILYIVLLDHYAFMCKKHFKVVKVNLKMHYELLHSYIYNIFYDIL